MRLMIGVIGFVLFFLYDYNQIKWNHPVLRRFFFVGVVLVFISTISALSFHVMSYIGVMISLVGLVFTIYALFFALDFEATYIDGKFKVYDQGIYAFCRHPGFYGLLLLYLGLAIAYQTEILIWMFVLFNSLNFLYIYYQDKVVFMKTFSDYGEYKKRVPFLIGSRKSLEECMKLWKKQ